VTSDNPETVPGRSRHWRLPGTWLALGGILAAVSAAVAWVAAVGSSSTVLIFLVGALLGILAGGMVCVRYLRSEMAADIGPQLRRVQSQLYNIEAAVNTALATQYDELSRPPWPPAISRPRPPSQPEQSARRRGCQEDSPSGAEHDAYQRPAGSASEAVRSAA
jgi:hypothetical protein